MSVVSIQSNLISASNDTKVFNKQSPFQSNGYAYIVLELSSPCHIVNIVFKNAGSAFVTILAGDCTQAKSIRRSLNKKTHFNIFDQMKTIVPETQLISYEQALSKQKIDKVKSFRQFNRLVNPQSAVFTCLAILVRPFVDATDQSVGIGFCEVYGQVRPESSVFQPATVFKTDTQIKSDTLKRPASSLNSPTKGSPSKKAKVST